MNPYLLRGLDLLAELSVVGSFSRYGYRLRERGFSPGDLDVDLAEQVFLVTGATSGIGLATARRLLELNATVILVGRSAERLAGAVQTLEGEVLVEQTDLSNLAEVSALAVRVAERFERVQGLIHNAGLLVDERALTQEGHEQAFATHVLAPFVLTQQLLPQLAAAPAGRVVFVSSGGMYTQRLDLERCQALDGDYDGVVAYAQQKRAQVLLAAEFEARAAATGVSFFSMHPGWVDTPGVARGLPRFYHLTRRLLRTPAEGADTIVWLAASPALHDRRSGFYLDRTERTTERLPGTRHRESERVALWELCERLTAPLTRARQNETVV